MTDRSLGVAVIGAGFAGNAHARAAAAARTSLHARSAVRFRLVAVVDPALPLAEAVARRHGFARAGTDWRPLCDDEDVDVVVVAAPDRFHAEMVVALIDAGNHVLCEKPLALSVDDADHIVRAPTTGPRPSRAISHEFRLAPVVRAAREAVDNGDIGTLITCSARYWANYGLDAATRSSWRFEGSVGSGVIGDLGSHLVDLAGTFLGAPDAVAGANIRHLDPDKNEDVAIWTTSYRTGASATFSVSRTTPAQYNGVLLELSGTQGLLQLDLTRPLEARVSRDPVPGGPIENARSAPLLDGDRAATDQHDLFDDQMLAFLSGLAGLEEPTLPTFEDGLQTGRVLDAVCRSAARRGAVIDLPPLDLPPLDLAPIDVHPRATELSTPSVTAGTEANGLPR